MAGNRQGRHSVQASLGPAAAGSATIQARRARTTSKRGPSTHLSQSSGTAHVPVPSERRQLSRHPAAPHRQPPRPAPAAQPPPPRPAPAATSLPPCCPGPPAQHPAAPRAWPSRKEATARVPQCRATSSCQRRAAALPPKAAPAAALVEEAAGAGAAGGLAPTMAAALVDGLRRREAGQAAPVPQRWSEGSAPGRQPAVLGLQPLQRWLPGPPIPCKGADTEPGDTQGRSKKAGLSGGPPPAVDMLAHVGSPAPAAHFVPSSYFVHFNSWERQLPAAMGGGH